MDVSINGLPQGYPAGTHTNVGFYFQSAGMTDYYSETTVAAFGFWSSGQWASQLRMWASTDTGNGNGTNIIYGDMDKTKVGWSGNTCIIGNMKTGSYQHLSHWKFEEQFDEETEESLGFYKVSFTLPDSCTGWTTNPHNKSTIDGKNTAWGFISKEDMHVDSNGDAWLTAWGGAEYSIGENEYKHQVQFTNIRLGEAESWCQDFLDLTDENCAAGDIKADLESWWGDYADVYSYLSPASKTFIKDTPADESGDVVAQAIARYNQLVRKYGLTNFIGTNVLGANNSIFVNNNTIIITTVVAVASACAVIFFVSQKKKKQVR